MGRWKRLRGYGVVAALVLTALRAHAEQTEIVMRVQSPEAMISTLLRDAAARSPTFRRLVDAIHSTNGIVYVESGTCRRGGLHACLLMSVTMAGPDRVLHVRVDTRTDMTTMTGDIGHELQHAIEALSEMGVTSSGRLEAFFGRSAGGPAVRGQLAFETEAAVHAGEAIRDEIHAYVTARHVRSNEKRLLALLGTGEMRSPTFRRLLECLDESDVIVYLQPNLTRAGLYGYLVHHVTSAGEYRYLRAYIDMQGADERMIGVIAHELGHATEVAGAAEVRDDEGLWKFFRRVAAFSFGCASGNECYETRVARDLEQVVARELKESR
jgi:hypothetical protein